MRSIFAIVLCLFTLGINTSITFADSPLPKVEAYSAVLIDSITGKVLFEKRCHARRAPASTTKMMTAILALEHGKSDDIVCASERVCETPFGSLHLKPGEKLSLYHLLYGMLLRSANDAAECVAEYIGGSESKFAEMMNAKAKEIGAVDTHFVNPHGLYDPKHYSTAYDLALIARYAIQYPLFNEIVRTKKARIDRSIDSQDVTLRNTAKFLWKFDGADGIKTGYTKEAGHCFVGSATRDGWRLISVVLKSKKAGEDTAAIIDYGFNNFKPVVFAQGDKIVGTTKVSGGLVDQINVIPASNLAFVVRKQDSVETRSDMQMMKLSAPVKKGEKVGTLIAYMNGRQAGSVDLLATESVQRTLAATIWLYTRSALVIIAIAMLGIFTYGTTIAKSTRRRRRRIPTRSREAYNDRPCSR